MDEIIANFLAQIGAGDILISIALSVVGLYIKKQFELMDRRGQDRVLENIVTMKYLKSLGCLTYATAIAVKEGKVNGEMTEAMELFKDCRTELDDIIIKHHAQQSNQYK